MRLNINTPRGQVALSYEQTLIHSIESHWPQFHAVQTPKDQPAEVDGFLIKENELYAVFETKTRDCNLAQMNQWGNEWLLSFDKLMHGADIAKRLRIPFIGFLYLIKEPIAMSIKLADKEGNFIPKMRLERTTTKRNINGGEVIRTNAFIDLSTANKFEIIHDNSTI
jgi:hypothetical protein